MRREKSFLALKGYVNVFSPTKHFYCHFYTIAGLRSNHPGEACQHYYYSPSSLSASLLVAENSSAPCPFSGSYGVSGPGSWVLTPPSVSGARVMETPPVTKGSLSRHQEEEREEQCETFMQVSAGYDPRFRTSHQICQDHDT